MEHAEHSRRNWEVLKTDNPLVHEWLDQYFQRFGLSHRLLLHHRQGIDLLCRELGEDARAVAELHVRDDLGRLPDDPSEMADVVWLPSGHPQEEEIVEELRRLFGQDFGLES